MPKSLSAHELLPPSPLLTLITIERSDARWTVTARGPDQAPCPGCRQISTSRHSRYVRSLKDLPTVGALRAHAQRSGLTLGQIVTQALTTLLGAFPRRRG